MARRGRPAGATLPATRKSLLVLRAPVRSGYNDVDMAKMTSTREIEVTFDGEVLRPDQPLDLEPNKTYRVRIERVETEPHSENGLQRILNSARDLGCPDLAEQHDHYLYGTPKK